MIVAKENIISAFVRRREDAGSVEKACAAVAQDLGLAEETVQHVVAEAEAVSDGELA